MADLTGRGESRRLMWGTIRTGIVLLMARVAERAVQRVIVGDVAVGADARWHHVRTRQLETSTGVVELAVRPLRRVMARVASRWKCCRDVIDRR